MKEFTRGFLLVAAFAGFALACWPVGQHLFARQSQAHLRAQWEAAKEKPRAAKPLTARAAKPLTARAARPRAAKEIAPRPFPPARLVIPDARLDTILVGGIRDADLRRGPGWMPGTARPGERGNCVVAGHRNVYGSPFLGLDRLQPGAEIQIQTPDASFNYTVVALSTVSDNDRTVTAAPKDNSARLTLITCTVPKTSFRLIVSAIQS